MVLHARRLDVNIILQRSLQLLKLLLIRWTQVAPLTIRASNRFFGSYRLIWGNLFVLGSEAYAAFLHVGVLGRRGHYGSRSNAGGDKTAMCASLSSRRVVSRAGEVNAATAAVVRLKRDIAESEAMESGHKV